MNNVMVDENHPFSKIIKKHHPIVMGIQLVIPRKYSIF
jgi:hypothetical protein